MKILHITNAYPTHKNSSYGIFIKEQIDSLKKKGHHCDVIFIDALTHGKLQYLVKIKAINQAAREADIIHCHHSYSAFITQVLANIKKPLVVSFLSSIKGETVSVFRKLIFNSVLNNCSAFIDKSDPDTEKQFNAKGYYLPNGVDMHFFREIKREDAFDKLGLQKEKYALFCSSGSILRKEKRYDLFKEVLRILNEKCQIPIKELVLSNIERKLTPYYYNAAALHLLTSDFEGSPNSVKEAIACNIPVVSTNVGNVNLLVRGIDGCYVSSSNRPEELAALCVKALKKERISGRPKLMEEKMDMDSIAEKLAHIYNLVLSKTK